MPEDTKEQLGDGQDDFGQAARQLASAAKSAGASAGAGAAANAAGAVVKAGVESGKAVSGVAVGTAAGGPWGAILAAAWSMRHTLFRVLVCMEEMSMSAEKAMSVLRIPEEERPKYLELLRKEV